MSIQSRQEKLFFGTNKIANFLAFRNSSMYRKLWIDKNIKFKIFEIGDPILLFTSYPLLHFQSSYSLPN